MHFRHKSISWSKKLINCFICFISCIDLLITLKQRGPDKGILFKGGFIPKLLDNPLVSCYLIKSDFLLSRTAHFDKKNIILPFFCFWNFWVFNFCIFSTIQEIRQHCFINRLNLIKSLNFWFLLSFHYILLARYLLKQIHRG